MLLWHLAWGHFKKGIMAKSNLTASSRVCPICDQPSRQLMNLIIHLAQQHNQLQGLVDDNVLSELKKALDALRLTKKNKMKMKVRC